MRQRSVGKKFDANKLRVRSIYQKGEHIKDHMNIASPEAASQALHGCSHLIIKTDQLLGRCLDRNAKRNQAVDTWEIMDKDICAALARKLHVQQPPVFLASKGWVEKCMVHHKVKSM